MNTRLHLQRISEIASDVQRGLSTSPKSLPPKLFYDAIGSELFEQITRLPEYYPTETERGILRAHADEMLIAAGAPSVLMELGAGSANKTTLLLQAALRRHPVVSFYPIDVSASALQDAQLRLNRELPCVRVSPIKMDYTNGIGGLRRIRGHKLVLYIGSSIGNFEPMEAALLLSRLRRALSPGDHLLLGTDMRKPEDVLIPAYDDPAGVTARFNLNLLARINRELAGDFDLEQFAHRVVWNRKESRIEMHLESLRTQNVAINALDMELTFESGERIHTENSYKFTSTML
ncbi:MAG TPA: L-histidine N(alpha)-methyltransferase, partial [Candidatus Acidoferrales bacterium]|nr:L-histidine N(alpha)-methyltransferase [Candidatus Acidoferrales bacterium]